MNGLDQTSCVLSVNYPPVEGWKQAAACPPRRCPATAAAAPRRGPWCGPSYGSSDGGSLASLATIH